MLANKNNLTKKFKKGDLVMITTGKDKGRTGNIIFIDRETERVKVGGLKLHVLHNKGGVSTKEGSLHLSNILHVDTDTNQPSRVGFKMEGDNKVRFLKKSGKTV